MSDLQAKYSALLSMFIGDQQLVIDYDTYSEIQKDINVTKKAKDARNASMWSATVSSIDGKEITK